MTADVAIVGYGPVGAVLAGLLGLRGINVVVLEREREVFALPRAAHVDHTGLRALQELGCLDDMLDEMLVNPGLDLVNGHGELMMRVPGNQRNVSGLPSSMYFHQPRFDRSVRAAAEACPSVTVTLGAEAVGVAAQDTGAVVRATTESGDLLEVQAAWVVGCDGAWSPVREWLSIGVEDLGFHERWLVVDLLLDCPPGTVPDRAVTSCDPARPLYSIPMPSPRHRFEFQLHDGEEDDRMRSEESVRTLVAPSIDPSYVTIERSAVYMFHGLIANDWRRGRVLIAGDAAHQMPPFLGQGMCSGIRDATNLAWKLEHVLRRGAPTELLDTYASERRPHVRRIVQAAVAFGQIICVTDPQEAAERDRRLREDPRPPTERLAFGLPRYEPGPLVLEGGGDLFVQPSRASDVPRLDDVVGRRFLVVGRTDENLGSSASWWRSIAGALVATADQLPDPDGVVARWMDGRGVRFVVVRPDRYVMAAGDDLDTATSSVASLLTGRFSTAINEES
jgi:3-(3-hydroxy-phenyl)propionate hydroxylase